MEGGHVCSGLWVPFKWLPGDTQFWNTNLQNLPGVCWCVCHLYSAEALAAADTGIFCCQSLEDKTGDFALPVCPVSVYMTTQIRFRTLENHLWACLVFTNRSNSQTRVRFGIHNATPKTPQSGIPLGWQYFIMRAFVLVVTVAGFHSLLLMPSAWLTWQALSRLQVSGAFSDHCCPCPGWCQNRRSPHLSPRNRLGLQLPFLEISTWSKHQMSRYTYDKEPAAKPQLRTSPK